MGGCVGSRPVSFRYSVPLQEQKALEGQTEILRHPNSGDTLVSSPQQGVFTLFDCITRAFQRYSERNMLGTKFGNEYQWVPYQEIRRQCINLGSTILNLNLAPLQDHQGTQYRFLGIYMKNRQEWVTTDLACMVYGICSVPLYDTLGNDALQHILEQTNLHVIVTDRTTIANLAKLKRRGKAGSLEHLILVDEPTQEDVSLAASSELRLESYRSLVDNSKDLEDFKPSSPDDLYTICYTSGTTGLPKGVMLSHGNLAADIAGVAGLIQVNPNDIHISYLPMAHIYERVMILSIIYHGASAGFYGGDVFKLTEDLAVLRPTIFPCVPRLLSRIYDRIQAKLGELTGAKASLAKTAIEAKLEKYRKTGDPTHVFYDALVFNKIKNLLGGRITKAVSASAPIAPQMLNFLRIALCCQILQAYGQTQTGGAATSTFLFEPEAGHVGGPLISCEVKLVDIPEMNYTSKDMDDNMNWAPRGEICTRGPSIFKGYFKMRRETKETIDREGWLHSGDVGRLNQNYSITIIDRKKNIFKLAQGEYVAPEKIENIYIKSKYVALAFVYGESLESYLIGVIQPERTELEPWAAQNGIEGSWEEVCEDDRVKEFILEQITGLGKEAGLFGFEQVRKIYLYPNAITPESGLLTPTFKIKRNDMKGFFQEILQFLYAN